MMGWHFALWGIEALVAGGDLKNYYISWTFKVNLSFRGLRLQAAASKSRSTRSILPSRVPLPAYDWDKPGKTKTIRPPQHDSEDSERRPKRRNNDKRSNTKVPSNGQSHIQSDAVTPSTKP